MVPISSAAGRDRLDRRAGDGRSGRARRLLGGPAPAGGFPVRQVGVRAHPRALPQGGVLPPPGLASRQAGPAQRPHHRRAGSGRRGHRSPRPLLGHRHPGHPQHRGHLLLAGRLPLDVRARRRARAALRDRVPQDLSRLRAGARPARPADRRRLHDPQADVRQHHRRAPPGSRRPRRRLEHDRPDGQGRPGRQGRLVLGLLGPAGDRDLPARLAAAGQPALSLDGLRLLLRQLPRLGQGRIHLFEPEQRARRSRHVREVLLPGPAAHRRPSGASGSGPDPLGSRAIRVPPGPPVDRGGFRPGLEQGALAQPAGEAGEPAPHRLLAAIREDLRRADHRAARAQGDHRPLHAARGLRPRLLRAGRRRPSSSPRTSAWGATPPARPACTST